MYNISTVMIPRHSTCLTRVLPTCPTLFPNPLEFNLWIHYNLGYYNQFKKKSIKITFFNIFFVVIKRMLKKFNKPSGLGINPRTIVTGRYLLPKVGRSVKVVYGGGRSVLSTPGIMSSDGILEEEDEDNDLELVGLSIAVLLVFRRTSVRLLVLSKDNGL
jgi:hypothetical protein